MPDCRICQTSYAPFHSFGKMPLANGFRSPTARDEEYFFELAVGACPSCGMVQLVDQPDPRRMFHDQYAFFSSTSRRMENHFRELAGQILANVSRARDPFVVEIGSNDGILLRHVAERGVRHLGVEPSENVGRAAVARGVNTVFRFFDLTLAREVRAKNGPADAIVAANVMCHIPDLHSVFRGVRELLGPQGTFTFEDPYLGDILASTSYDQIYDEHVFYFSVRALDALLARHDLEIVDVAPQSVHGGSMRYTVAHAGARKPTPAVAAQREVEVAMGLFEPKTFEAFSAGIEASRRALVALLKDLRDQGRRVVGYGATSKSTTVLNYCGITPDLIEFITDTTPGKQGLLTPGAHIPVKAPDAFHAQYPDYALLLAWNHREEILAKEQSFKAAGGKWIVYVPKVQVLM